MKKNQNSGYKGVLAEPMVYQTPFVILLEPDKAEEIRKRDIEAYNRQYKERILALFEYYQIDPSNDNAWAELAMDLAQAHVPGFQVIDGSAPHVGRRARWRIVESAKLLTDVQALMDKGLTASAACNILVKRPEYRKEGQDEKKAHKTLYRRYQEAKGIYKQSGEPVFLQLLEDITAAHKE